MLWLIGFAVWFRLIVRYVLFCDKVDEWIRAMDDYEYDPHLTMRHREVGLIGKNKEVWRLKS